MPSPLKWLFNKAKQVYQRFRGDKREKTVRLTPRLRDDFQTSSSGWATHLTERLYDKEITIQQWQRQFRESLKDQYIAQYIAAKGGRDNMTQADWGRLGGLLKKQYEYHNGFAQDVLDGKLSRGQAKFRAELYHKSAKQAFERAKTEGLGMPPLPAYPGDGKTVCKTNCACHWEIEETETEWRATWALGAAEHCNDCVVNATKWKPLVMSK